MGSLGAKIVLPDGLVPLAAQPWQGANYWWGGKQDVANAMMTMNNPVLATANTTLSFDLVYDTEDQWDFIGSRSPPRRRHLGHHHQYQHHLHAQRVLDRRDQRLPGRSVRRGLGGFTNYNASWPDPEVETSVCPSTPARTSSCACGT